MCITLHLPVFKIDAHPDKKYLIYKHSPPESSKPCKTARANSYACRKNHKSIKKFFLLTNTNLRNLHPPQTPAPTHANASRHPIYGGPLFSRRLSQAIGSRKLRSNGQPCSRTPRGAPRWNSKSQAVRSPGSPGPGND